MANEAVIVELLGDPKGCPVSYLCADNVGIEKGTILWFGDNRKVSGASTIAGPFAGIAATEKVANDGSTHIGCWTKGIFDLTANTAITCGALVKLSGQNVVTGEVSVGNISGGYIVGKCLETADTAEVVQVAVGIY